MLREAARMAVCKIVDSPAKSSLHTGIDFANAEF